MSARLEVVDGSILVEATASTAGWVLVGFHRQQQLAGSRLVMAAVTDGVPILEEHVADPPRHAARTHGATAALLDAAEASGQTTARFTIPMDPKDQSLPTLTKDEPIWVWLAWSHSDDLQHHSARREGVWVSL